MGDGYAELQLPHHPGDRLWLPGEQVRWRGRRYLVRTCQLLSLGAPDRILAVDPANDDRIQHLTLVPLDPAESTARPRPPSRLP